MICTTRILACFAYACAAWAGTNEWTNVGPEGGSIFPIAVDPHDSTNVWAGTGVGVFRSRDGGTSWSNAGLTGLVVSRLILDPQWSETAYAITNGAPNQDNAASQLFKTVDGGASWSEVDAGLPQMDGGAFAIDPQNPDTLYASTGFNGGQGGIYKSTDGGVGWRAVNAGLPDKFISGPLAIDPFNTSTIYAAGVLSNTQGTLIAKSADGGASWSIGRGPSEANAVGLTIEPNPLKTRGVARPGTLYLATNNGVFKSTDGAASWSAASAGLAGCCVFGAILDGSRPRALYVVTGDRLIYKSTNGAASWNPTGGALPSSANNFVIDPGDARTLYAADGGILKSTDGGVSWSSANAGIRAIQLLSFAADPQNPGTWYAGTDSGLFKSVDSGATWQGAVSGLKLEYPSDWVMALAADPLIAGNVYAGTGDDECGYGAGGLFRSTDAAESWNAPATFPVTCMGVLAVDSKNTGTIYAGSHYSGVLKSTDGGATWAGVNKEMPTPAWITALAVDSHNTATLYAATQVYWNYLTAAQVGAGLFRSTDGGNNWTSLPQLNSTSRPQLAKGYFSSLAVDPHTEGTVYAAVATWDGVEGGLWKSSDSGATWRILPLSTGSVSAVTVDPQDSSKLYAAAVGGVIRSTDGGQSWTAISGNIGSAAALVWDPQRPNTLYAAGTGGLWAIAFEQ